ncbi:MAG: hypothetical protein OXS35_08200 [Dehalococcoidia bacterium]|nr:hypothetical protein [Dehalococcoidia bacterium]
MSQKYVDQDGLLKQEDRPCDILSRVDGNGVIGDVLLLRSTEGDVFLPFSASWAGLA